MIILTFPYFRATPDEFKAKFASRGEIADGGCKRSQLHFMDLNGDGLKDYACVDSDTGAVEVKISIADSEGNPTYTWSDRGTVATGAKGRNGTNVFFAEWVFLFLCSPFARQYAFANYYSV